MTAPAYRTPDEEATIAREIADLKSKLGEAERRAVRAETDLKNYTAAEKKASRKAWSLTRVIGILPVVAWLSYLAYCGAEALHFSGFVQVLALLTVAIPCSGGFIAYLIHRYDT
ncbi:MAG TPA: hypothetical protein VM577_08250 [Anaerovoracaceae bacterium]|nr:hypothetical protein [Anaerovoracaceae bacterium]